VEKNNFANELARAGYELREFIGRQNPIITGIGDRYVSKFGTMDVVPNVFRREDATEAIPTWRELAIDSCGTVIRYGTNDRNSYCKLVRGRFSTYVRPPTPWAYWQFKNGSIAPILQSSDVAWDIDWDCTWDRSLGGWVLYSR